MGGDDARLFFSRRRLDMARLRPGGRRPGARRVRVRRDRPRLPRGSGPHPRPSRHDPASGRRANAVSNCRARRQAARRRPGRQDEAGEHLLALLKDRGADTTRVWRDTSYTTPVKPPRSYLQRPFGPAARSSGRSTGWRRMRVGERRPPLCVLPRGPPCRRPRPNVKVYSARVHPRGTSDSRGVVGWLRSPAVVASIARDPPVLGDDRRHAEPAGGRGGSGRPGRRRSGEAGARRDDASRGAGRLVGGDHDAAARELSVFPRDADPVHLRVHGTDDVADRTAAPGPAPGLGVLTARDCSRELGAWRPRCCQLRRAASWS